MDHAFFVLSNTGVSNRFKLYLKNNAEQTVLVGQLREMKAMCLDELSLIRSTAPKDSSYDRQRDEAGYFYILRANDGHELGRGNTYPSEDLVREEIEFVKLHAASAELFDETPEEERLRVRDLAVEHTNEVLKEIGLSYG